MKDKTLIYATIGIIIALIIAVFLLKYANVFAISARDLQLVDEITLYPGNNYENFTNFAIAGGGISFNLGTISYTVYPDRNEFFMLDSSPTIYNSFPDLTDGTHTIIRYTMITMNDETQIHIQKFVGTFSVVTRTVYQNITVANQTVYVDKIIYVNLTNSTNTIQYVNQTTEKQVLVEPDLTYILKKYQMQLIAIVGVGLVYYLTRRRRR